MSSPPRSQTIIRLKLIPRLIQRRKNRRTNHLLLHRRRLRNLTKIISLRFPLNDILLDTKTYLIRMHLGNSLHVIDLDLVRHHQITHVDFIPSRFGPEHFIQGAQERAQVI